MIEPICIENNYKFMVILLNGNLISSLQCLLVADFMFLSVNVNGKPLNTSQLLETEKNADNTNRKLWSLYQVLKSIFNLNGPTSHFFHQK
jgi:hypothetical protein